MHKTLEKAVKSNVQKKNEINPEMQNKLVCEEILSRLGTIKDLHQVNAHNVFDNRWRVDVWIEEWKPEMYGPSYRIKHSHFCRVEDNCISRSSPELPDPK